MKLIGNKFVRTNSIVPGQRVKYSYSAVGEEYWGDVRIDNMVLRIEPVITVYEGFDYIEPITNAQPPQPLPT